MSDASGLPVEGGTMDVEVLSNGRAAAVGLRWRDADGHMHIETHRLASDCHCHETHDELAVLDAFRHLVEAMNGCVAILVAEGYAEDQARRFVMAQWTRRESGDDE